MKTSLALLGVIVTLSATAALTFAQQQNDSPATQPQTLQDGWEEIDTRVVFLTTELASVESSLQAVDKALRTAGYRISAKENEAEGYRQGNESMDRNGGGPVPWDQFYGDTARKFYYHNTVWTTAQLKTPPQFDNIYRANAADQKRAMQDAAALGNKVDALLNQRRKLEDEQSALWAKIAFRIVSSQDLVARPLYRFEPAAKDVDADRLEAIKACCDFIRAVNRQVAQAQDAVDADQRAVYKHLLESTRAAREELDDQLVHRPHLVMDWGDVKTPLGKLALAARRLEDVSKNIDDACRNATDGDQANDQQRKNTSRGLLQEMLINYAETFLTVEAGVNGLARDWKITPDVEKPEPRAMLSVERPDTTPPQGLAQSSSPNPDQAKPGIVPPTTVGSALSPVSPMPATNSIGMSLVLIHAGRFTMGSPKNEEERHDNEEQKEVTIAKPFYIAATHVTQKQWKAVMGTEPSHFRGDDLPVEQVSWNDAQEFCQKLSQMEKKTYRLPTEAEWEYACRAGTTGPYGGTGNLDEMGWYGANSNRRTHIVGEKRPNAWGLYDMHGNLWQWCEDSYDASSRVMRGGGWLTKASGCRSALRNKGKPDTRDYNVGFRVVMDLP